MLKLYNTLTKKLEEIPKKESLNLYTCGPTVYNYAHIGNLRTYIFEDILHRVLEYNGFKVNHAMNITDVGHLVGDGDDGEDKLEVGAKREGKSPLAIADFYTHKFFSDTDELNIIRPNKVLSATQSILEQIEIIKILEKKGFIYKGRQAVYFDTSKFPGYGKLSGQTLSEKKTARGEVIKDAEKKNQTDFALWFFLTGRYENHILHWPSPWGEGFPGWHIECSAISRKLLGQPFDIHCGGVDHIGTHHENEIAQSEAAFGVPLANIWMHGEFLVIPSLTCVNCGFMFSKPSSIVRVEVAKVENEYGKCPKCEFTNDIKMAKSGGNFITLDKFKEKSFLPMDFRYMCLQAHYRTQLNFTWEALEGAHNALQKLYQFSSSVKPGQIGCAEYEQKFKDSINDDLNTPQSLGVVWDLINDKKIPVEAKINSLLKFDNVLGLKLNSSLEVFVDIKDNLVLSKLTNLREEARKAKNFAKSDELREKIEALGYVVLDTPEGQKVKKKLNF